MNGDPGVVQALTEALEDEAVGVRWCAARGLMRIGPGAASALPALRKVLKDEHHLVRKFVRKAIEKIEAGLPVNADPPELF